MNSHQAKQLSLPDIMSRLGYEPTKIIKRSDESASEVVTAWITSANASGLMYTSGMRRRERQDGIDASWQAGADDEVASAMMRVQAR